MAIPKLFFLPNSSIGQFCEYLSENVGQGIYYDRFEIEDTKWFSFVINMVTAMNNDKTLCGCFVIYSSFVAGTMNSARRIHFFVLRNEELNYENYIEKCVVDKECSVCYKSHTEHYFPLSYQSERIFISFEARLFPKLPSEIIFAQCVEKNRVGLSSLRNNNI